MEEARGLHKNQQEARGLHIHEKPDREQSGVHSSLGLLDGVVPCTDNRVCLSW
jgi:hypothetical protein